VELANGQCLSCHSVEYVVTQPPLPRTFWATSVKKMREKYGAAVAEEQVEPLLDYLTKHYGVEATNTASSATAVLKPVTLVPPGTPISGAAVATNYWCLSCHDISTKKVGPAYKDIADKYRNDADAYAKIAEQVQKGGSGKWGPVMMPPFPMVSAAETKAVAEWILSQK
jgi:sulfite dehydrogenase